ncbi:MAG: DUF2799 domain-containing protein, partial [Desulfobacterales bacterium]|nr:DUF2799 domain-containing protein [Desulfobacterales bacterium]
MRWSSLICTTILLFFFAGCATLTKEECTTADWYEIGYEDGSRGYAPARIAEHRKACAEYGITADAATYRRGRRQGLTHYCTPHKGYRLGLSGRDYNDVCPEHLTHAFKEGYNQGREIYLLKREVERARRENDELVKELARINTDISQKEAGLRNACKTTQSCQALLNEIRDLDREKAEIESH